MHREFLTVNEIRLDLRNPDSCGTEVNNTRLEEMQLEDVDLSKSVIS
ncbi:MAG: hypothetical protein QUS12_01770 [Methanosarcina sp.]|nr:hypothetical protein [Methanosarcina sp.]